MRSILADAANALFIVTCMIAVAWGLAFAGEKYMGLQDNRVTSYGAMVIVTWAVIWYGVIRDSIRVYRISIERR